MTVKRTRPNGENSIYPYRNGFAAYVWITTPAGRRVRKYVYGKTREDVHRDWIALQAKARRGSIATKVPTVGQYLHRWLEEVVEPNLAPLTVSTYETLVRLYLDPGLGHLRLDRLKVRDVQAWFNQLQSECQCCAQGKDQKRALRDQALARCCAKGKCCHSYASGRTIKDARTVLRSALSNAMSEELVERNVARWSRRRLFALARSRRGPATRRGASSSPPDTTTTRSTRPSCSSSSSGFARARFSA